MIRSSTAIRTTLAAVLLAIPSSVAAASPTASADPAPYCGIRWGSLDERADVFARTHVTSVRSGRHDCYDRLVVDLGGEAAGFSVGYVAQVRGGGEETAVPLRGGARLQVVVIAPSYDESGHETYRPANQAELTDVTGYRTFRQIAWAGSYEGYSTVGLGVRARLPFRVFTVPGPGEGSRLVVDVAHGW
jgi:hypothetical protein